MPYYTAYFPMNAMSKTNISSYQASPIISFPLASLILSSISMKYSKHVLIYIVYIVGEDS